jgi:hypothetical protein
MIIQSRTTDYKNSKTNWCKDRREICNDCQNNSKWYETKTIKERLLRLVNLGNYCLICSCGIAHKTRNAMSSCGLTEINEPPKWQRVNIKR